MDPGDAITYAEAMEITGRSDTWIRDKIRERGLTRQGSTVDMRLSRTEMEELALEFWKPHPPGRPPNVARVRRRNGYLIGITELAEILGVSRQQAHRLVAKGRFPTLTTRSGHKVFRRPQVEVIAAARVAKR